MPARTVTISQPVSDLHVQNYGAPISVTTAAGHGPVRVTESLSYSTAGPRPAVTDTVTRGLLTLSAPACANPDYQSGPGCNVGFSVTVPAGVAVTAAAMGGAVTVTGAAAANISSGGGPVYVAGVSGPLTVTTDGGDVQAEAVTGTLTADTGGGTLTGAGLRSAAATVTTESGEVTLGFAAAPESVRVDTGGWNATLSVPGGPYKVTTDGYKLTTGGDAANYSVSVPVSPAAHRSISVSTDGGDLQISPA